MVAMELAAELSRLGHVNELLAVGVGHDGRTTGDLPALTGSVEHRPIELVRAAWQLRRWLRSHAVDVVLVHGGAALQVAVLAGVRQPLVYQLIMGMPIDQRGPLWRHWWGRLLDRCAAVVSLTDALTDETRQLGYGGPVALIPNARSAARFGGVDRAAATAALRVELGVPPQRALVGFVGHLVEQKRPDVAVKVVEDLVGRGVDAHLVLVGGGPLAASVANQVRRDGLVDRVSLLGHREDVEQILAAIDLLVLPSDGEGMPGVVIEAQMAGCPVVSFPVGGVGEIVADGRSGVVLAAHDPAAMADEVARLLADATMREAMSVVARRLSERFTMTSAAERYDRMLRVAVEL